MPWVCLRFVIVVFPDHTHLLFLIHGITPFLDAISCENSVYRNLTFFVAEANVTMSVAAKIKSPKPSNQNYVNTLMMIFSPTFAHVISSTLKCLTLCMLGNFCSCFCCRLLTF